MPHAPNLPAPVNGTAPLKLQIPENRANGHSSYNGTNGVLSPPFNGTNGGPLSPPMDTTPKKPPMPRSGRPILPMKKSQTLPIHFEEKLPPKPSSSLLNGRNFFITKPLTEVHTIQQQPTENRSYLTTRSPSPYYRRSSSSASVETGSIAELARRHDYNNILISRSPSPSLSLRSSTSQYSTCSSNGTFVPLGRSTSMTSPRLNRTPTPRRMYPQSCDGSDRVDLRELRSKEQAPVVFDANLSFVLGCNKQPLRQKFQPVAAHLEEGTSSNYLSNKIDNFLKRTDHVMDEWRRLGHKDDPNLDYYGLKRGVGRSKSATNIMIKGFTLFSRNSRASSVCSRGISEDRTTVSGVSEIGEVRESLIDFCYVFV